MECLSRSWYLVCNFWEIVESIPVGVDSTETVNGEKSCVTLSDLYKYLPGECVDSVVKPLVNLYLAKLEIVGVMVEWLLAPVRTIIHPSLSFPQMLLMSARGPYRGFI